MKGKLDKYAEITPFKSLREDQYWPAFIEVDASALESAIRVAQHDQALRIANLKEYDEKTRGALHQRLAGVSDSLSAIGARRDKILNQIKAKLVEISTVEKPELSPLAKAHWTNLKGKVEEREKIERDILANTDAKRHQENEALFKSRDALLGEIDTLSARFNELTASDEREQKVNQLCSEHAALEDQLWELLREYDRHQTEVGMAWSAIDAFEAEHDRLVAILHREQDKIDELVSSTQRLVIAEVKMTASGRDVLVASQQVGLGQEKERLREQIEKYETLVSKIRDDLKSAVADQDTALEESLKAGEPLVGWTGRIMMRAYGNAGLDLLTNMKDVFVDGSAEGGHVGVAVAFLGKVAEGLQDVIFADADADDIDYEQLRAQARAQVMVTLPESKDSLDAETLREALSPLTDSGWVREQTQTRAWTSALTRRLATGGDIAEPGRVDWMSEGGRERYEVVKKYTVKTLREGPGAVLGGVKENMGRIMTEADNSYAQALANVTNLKECGGEIRTFAGGFGESVGIELAKAGLKLGLKEYEIRAWENLFEKEFAAKLMFERRMRVNQELDAVRAKLAELRNQQRAIPNFELSSDDYRASIYQAFFESDELMIEVATTQYAKSVNYDVSLEGVPCDEVAYHRYKVNAAEYKWKDGHKLTLRILLSTHEP